MNLKNKLNLGVLFFIISLYGCENDSTPSDAIEPAVKLALTTKTFTISQIISAVVVEREVIIQTPNIINSTKNYPLVFAFHGNGGNNKSWINSLKSFTDRGDFVGIYPQGYLNSWNLGVEKSKADDLAFVNLIITELRKYQNLNFDKMYALGTSNGAAMTNELALKTTHFKAIAPIVSQLLQKQTTNATTNPVSVYQVNGALDPTIPISGGNAVGHVFLSAEGSAVWWAIQFKCATSFETETIGLNTLKIYKNCDSSKEVRYYRLENGTHNIFPEDPLIYNKIWEFFNRF